MIVLAAARWVTAPRARALDEALLDPRGAQRRVVERLARSLATTEYGRSFGVTDAASFRARVPVARWEELSPWVDRQRQEEGAILSAERVLFYEKTSGSSGPAKYIPYSSTLRRTFSRMFTAWAHDLLANGPGLKTGKLYFSVSPTFHTEAMTAKGVPVGTADDRDYLEGWLRPLLGAFVVAPPGLGREHDAAVFRRKLAIALMLAEDLEVISVWSPSFLTALLEYIEENRDALELPRARRAALDEGQWTRVWPNLKLISCWASAGALPLAARVRALFPGVMVQGKGLLATEGPVTVPLVGAPHPVPLVDDVLVELLREDGALIDLVDAVQGDTYSVVISPLGGLPRYRLGDRVRVSGVRGATPCLELLGRGDATSDLAGEKLSEAFVSGALGALSLPATARAALVPVRTPRDHYVLVIDEEVGPDLAAALEAKLSEAHHYRQARLLGQLQAARVIARRGSGHWLTEHQLRRGLKLGDIKPSTLVTTPADEILTGLLR